MHLKVVSAVAAALVAVGSAMPARGAPVDVDAQVTFAAGYDSNPLRVSGVSGNGPAGAFAESAFEAGISVAPGRRAVLFFDAAGLARRHGSSTENADYERGDLRAGVLLPRIRAGHTRLSLSLGGIHRIRRSTYTDRLTGDIYEIVVDAVPVPPTTVPIPDRFDSDTTGAFMDLSWRLNRRLRLFLDSGYEQTDFVQDYTTTTPLDALDFESLVVEPGFAFRVNEVLLVVGSMAWTSLDFDDQPALDGSGAEVPGVMREYRYTQYRLRAIVSAGRFWSVNVGWLGSNREDMYEGYYDFDGWAGFVSASRAVGPRSRIQMFLSDQKQDYASATVAGDPNGETRGSETLRLSSRFDHTFHRRFGVFFQGGLQRTDNEDPVFAYDRDWSSVGISVGWR